jgi:AcrR family transcriptional regulator
MNEHSFMSEAATATMTKSTAGAEPKREAILAAALELFSEHTFEGCAVPLIAERAGVATGTIYRYFDGKEALVNAVYQRWKGRLAADLLAAASPDQTARQQFHAWWTGLARFATEHPVAFSFLELHHHEPYLDETSRRLAAEIDGAAVATVEQGQRDGVMRAGAAPLLVALVFGAFCGVVRARQTYGAVFGADPFADAEDAAWDLLGQPDPTTDQKAHS